MAIAICSPEQFVGFVVAVELFLRRIKLQRASEARGNVGKVSQRGGEMSGFGISVRLLAAADAVQKIAMMRDEAQRTLHFLDELVTGTVKLPAGFFAEDHHALRSVEGVSVLVPFLNIG